MTATEKDSAPIKAAADKARTAASVRHNPAQKPGQGSPKHAPEVAPRRQGVNVSLDFC